jgi:hypothetical protein
MLVNPTHPEKTESPIDAALFPNVILFKLVHPKKALSSIETEQSTNVMLIKPIQSL